MADADRRHAGGALTDDIDARQPALERFAQAGPDVVRQPIERDEALAPPEPPAQRLGHARRPVMDFLFQIGVEAAAINVARPDPDRVEPQLGLGAVIDGAHARGIFIGMKMDDGPAGDRARQIGRLPCRVAEPVDLRGEHEAVDPPGRVKALAGAFLGQQRLARHRRVDAADGDRTVEPSNRAAEPFEPVAIVGIAQTVRQRDHLGVGRDRRIDRALPIGDQFGHQFGVIVDIAVERIHRAQGRRRIGGLVRRQGRVVRVAVGDRDDPVRGPARVRQDGCAPRAARQRPQQGVGGDRRAQRRAIVAQPPHQIGRLVAEGDRRARLAARGRMHRAVAGVKVGGARGQFAGHRRGQPVDTIGRHVDLKGDAGRIAAAHLKPVDRAQHIFGGDGHMQHRRPFKIGPGGDQRPRRGRVIGQFRRKLPAHVAQRLDQRVQIGASAFRQGGKGGFVRGKTLGEPPHGRFQRGVERHPPNGGDRHHRIEARLERADRAVEPFEGAFAGLDRAGRLAQVEQESRVDPVCGKLPGDVAGNAAHVLSPSPAAPCGAFDGNALKPARARGATPNHAQAITSRINLLSATGRPQGPFRGRVERPDHHRTRNMTVV